MTRQMSSPIAQQVEMAENTRCRGVAASRRASARWTALAGLATVLMAMLTLVAPASGQEDAPGEAGEPELELDIEALLKHDAVLPERINTPIWLIEPNVGRRLVALPLKVTPGGVETELGASPSLSVRGGRFLMWQIEPAEAEDDPRNRARQLDRRGGPTGGFARRQADEDDASLPEDAPRLARRITVQPDGQLQWGLERSLPNAVLQEGEQLYALRIRPERMRELQPDRPERVQPGGNQSRAELARQRREAERAFLEQRRAFGELRSAVMALPDTFEVEQPARIWAIFEVADAVRELSIEGDQPPLPWSIHMEDFEILRSLAGAGGRRGGALDQEGVDTLRRVAAADHPLSNRLAAYAVIDAGAIDQVEPHDTLYNLLQALLESEDEVARRTVLTALVETPRPNAGTLSLLRHASNQADPQMKLISLRGMLQSDPRDSDRLSQMVSTTNELLADSDGPDPATVLAELIEAVSDQGDEVVAYVAANLSFDRLSSDRLVAAIRYVVVAAGEHPLASGWLDQQLLGNANPNLVEQTLEVIAAADTGSPWVREAARRGITALFGPSAVEDDDSATTLALDQRIPIHNTSHALFRSLNSGHSRVRELAWRSLDNFVFVGENQQQRVRSRQRSTEDEQITVYSELVAAALNQSPTPTQAVTFLSRQPDPRRAAAATLHLLLEADEPAAAQAARALHGSGWEIGSVMTAMRSDERAEAARLLYEYLTDETPLVTALLAHDDAGRRGRGNLVEWFGQRVAEGALPMPGEWTEPFRNEEDLLAIAGSDDSQQAAGAVAALVYAAGGDDMAVQEQVDRFAELAGADQTQLASAWASARQDIYARRLAASEGSYRVVALVHAGRGRGMDTDVMPDRRRDDAAAEPAERMTLGVVDLQADGRSISLSNDIVPVSLADSELAIRIERVHALQGFRHDSLDALSLEDVREPLDLAPQPNGSWVGSVRLRDGRRLEVRMEPVE